MAVGRARAITLFALRFAFLLAVVLIVLDRARAAEWTAALEWPENRFRIITLGEGALWSPPAVPIYEDFRSVVDDLPTSKPADLRVVRRFERDAFTLGLLLRVWPLTIVCSALYLLVRGHRVDYVLHMAAFVAAGLTLAAVLCFSLWLLLGGWGPPTPAVFGLLGVAVGISAATVQLKLKATDRKSAMQQHD